MLTRTASAGGHGLGRCVQAAPRPARRAQLCRATAPATTSASSELAAASSGYCFASCTTQGPRPTMEDELRLERDAKLGFTYAAVFDGHGGDTAAQWLRQHLYDSVLAAMDRSFTAADAAQEPVPGKLHITRPVKVASALTRVFQEVDARLIQALLAAKGKPSGASGATATVALVHKDKVLTASIGDSCAVLCRNGSALPLAKQHRLYGVGEAVLEEVQRVTDAGGWVVDGRVCNILAVARAFGDPEFKGQGLQQLLDEGVEKGSWTAEFAAGHKFVSDPVIVTPDVTQALLVPEDEFLVVATDGLWDCMPMAEVIRYARNQFRHGRSAQDVADALVDVAVKRYTADNVAVIVADLKGRDAWTAKPAKAAGGGGGRNGSNFFTTIFTTLGGSK